MENRTGLNISYDDYKRAGFRSSFFPMPSHREYWPAVREEMLQNEQDELVDFSEQIASLFDEEVKPFVGYGAAYACDIVSQMINDRRLSYKNRIQSQLIMNENLRTAPEMTEDDLVFLEKVLGEGSKDTMERMHKWLSYTLRPQNYKDAVLVGFFSIAIPVSVILSEGETS